MAGQVFQPGSLDAVQSDPTARVAGEVVDRESGEAVVGASLRLSGTELRTSSDSGGQFLFPAVPLGSHELVVDHLAYETVRDSLHVEDEGARYEVTVRMDAYVVELAPIEVRVVRPGPLEEVHDRLELSRRLGTGSVFDRRDIEQSGAQHVTTLLRTVPGVRMQPVPGRAGAQSLRVHARNDCPPSFYVDGMRLPLDEGSVDDVVTLGSVETLEVYRRLSQLPGEYADEQAQQCGAVAIWSRRGTSGGEPFGWRRLVALLSFASLSRVISSLFF